MIGVGDVLGISVWKEEGLTVAIPVRPDGKVSVPLLGEIDCPRIRSEQLGCKWLV